MSVRNNTTQIDSRNVAYARRLAQWQRVRDALEGEDAIKQKGTAYLPQPSGLDHLAYKAYVARAAYYPVAERTLRGMTGMVFRNDPSIALPPRLEPMLDMLTVDGFGFESLAEEMTKEVLSLGRYGLLLDYPKEGANVNTPPRLATYFAEDITNWRSAYVNGFKKLTRVVLRDEIDNEDDDDVVKYLELLLDADGLYVVRVWKSIGATGKGAKTAFVMAEENLPLVNGKRLTEIPFFFVNAYDRRPEPVKPPFIDLTDINFGHYRNSADYEHALFLTAQPTPWVSGALNADTRPTAIGPSALWVLPEGAQAGMLEFTGAGIGAQRQAMLDKEERMASLGARMIIESKVRNEAAETARQRGNGETSLLSSVVNSVEESLFAAFRLAATWQGADPEAVDVRINRDWIEAALQPAELDAVVKAWQSGAISRQTMHENLQRGEIIPADRTFEEEKALIDEGGDDLTLGGGGAREPDDDDNEDAE